MVAARAGRQLRCCVFTTSGSLGPRHMATLSLVSSDLFLVLIKCKMHVTEQNDTLLFMEAAFYQSKTTSFAKDYQAISTKLFFMLMDFHAWCPSNTALGLGTRRNANGPSSRLCFSLDPVDSGWCLVGIHQIFILWTILDPFSVRLSNNVRLETWTYI